MNKVLRCCLVAVAFALCGHATQPDSDGLLLLWRFDEVGSKPIAIDESANQRNGDSYGSVMGGFASGSQNAFGGFTSVASYVLNTNVISSYASRDFSFIAWIKDPCFTNSGVRIIGRGVNSKPNVLDGWGSDVPWQVYLENDGTVRLGIRDWGNVTNLGVSAAMTWKSNTWYQIAVVQSFRHDYSADIRYEHFKVYVTPAGSASVGEPAIDFTHSRAAGLATGKGLVVGGGHDGWGNGSPEGFLDGYIDEVSLWSKALSEDELNRELKDFKPQRQLESFATFHYTLNELGVKPDAVDATTNGFDACSFGNVVGGSTSFDGTSYGGFTSTGSYVALTNGPTAHFREKSSSLIMWVRPQGWLEDRNHLLMRIFKTDNKFGADGDVPLQLWVDSEGRMNLGIQNWGGKFATVTSEPLVWNEKRWHQVALIFSRKKYTNNSLSYNFKVYVTPRGAEAISEPVIDHSISWGATGLADGKWFLFGGGAKGWYSVSAPAGYWNGEIDEISFYDARLLDEVSLLDNLNRFKPLNNNTIIIIR